MLGRFLIDESGTTAIEYALLASVFVLMALAGWTALGNAVAAKFAYIQTSVADATTGAGS